MHELQLLNEPGIEGRGGGIRPGPEHVMSDRSDRLIPRLLEHRSRFLDFLERRTGNREVAEEVLQAAWLKGLERGGAVRDEQSAVAWFYRLLRNALADRARRTSTETKALERHALEPDVLEPSGEERAEVCQCLAPLVDSLRPAYAEILRAVDLQERPVREFAAQAGIAPGNATVRLHRARKALREALVDCCGACARHGCLDCGCASPPAA